MGVYNFQGVVLGGDGSNDAGRVGADSAAYVQDEESV